MNNKSNISPKVEKTTETELKHLISSCINQDRKSQEVLYKMLHGKLLALCLRYFKNRDDALNIMNQGFLKIFNNLSNFDSRQDLMGWAYRIVQNTALDHLKSTSRRLQWEENYTENPEVPVEPLALSELYSKDLMDMIQRLPESTSLVFNLHIVDGYSHQEISDLLGISVGTSKWHVHHAKYRLKEMILKQQITVL